ncbi:hypothetical protein FC70_GL001402 [Paucilactobacillus oligofermentans DSM 15707 = LMG 22743]|uniref:DivIVA domain-containing protein n=1 Tax=Paucilactobacillus oligofermentans DSM 15707 = LMG 22743 TaxID=1423778 RepID=A0A0R1RBV5_9LACO|nr:DivIVA domain-containing protein [Paucilactobacillus oligofermentans]KRL54605.1 hypothetical protein FC70_GL001402 [Paucilactobacillus oligofermentans DSM 15707 = LMG 22743]CUS26486.1 Cell division protein DivIVA homologue [Paucilactobacillus oligofermentans DSM 15707 = LMG 22743]
MDLSISKIKNNRFNSRLGGYSYQQVDEYVADILGELTELRAINRSLKQQDLLAKRQFSVLASMKEEILDLIMSSQKYSAKWKDRSARQAQVTIRFADQEAEQIIAEAQVDAKVSVIAKIKEVKLQTDTLDKLKVIVATYQNEMLELYKQQIEISNDKIDSLRSVEPTEMKAIYKGQEFNHGFESQQRIDFKIDNQQVNLNVTAPNNGKAINKDALKIQNITTGTNEKNELVINLALNISK